MVYTLPPTLVLTMDLWTRVNTGYIQWFNAVTYISEVDAVGIFLVVYCGRGEKEEMIA